MQTILIALILSGPLVLEYPENRPDLIIHLGIDIDSKRIPGELSYPSSWYIKYSHIIRQRYNIIIKEDALDTPWFQVGKNGPREEFLPRSFVAGGIFIMNLAYQVRLFEWEEDLSYTKHEYKPELCTTPIPLSDRDRRYHPFYGR